MDRCVSLPVVDRMSTFFEQEPSPHGVPMLRHIAEPLDARGFEAHVGVEAAGDGPVDDGLLLLLQQRDELPLGGDMAPDAPVHVVQVPDHGALFGEGREG